VSETVVAWLVNPVTLALAGVVVSGLIVVLELLLSSLARLGNVRFQGIVDDHPNIVPPAIGGDTHLSSVTDILRWVEMASLGVLWMVVGAFPWTQGWARFVAAIVATAVLILGTRLSSGSLQEDTVARLLKLVSPMVAPLVPLVGRHSAGQPPVATTEDDEEEVSDREIQAYLQAGQAAGIFEGEEGEFVESLVDFFDTVVREVMTPRTEMVTVPDTISVDELLGTFAETLKSRIPVYHETVDKIIGVAHVKNFVQVAGGSSRPPISELVNPCLVVPESKELGELLRDFQRNHQQMAIVVDEYGGTAGLVTLEDILEEIVGEIEDEHDAGQPPEWQEVEPGVFRLQGRASLETLGTLFGRDVVDEDVDTVGGLVFARHGTVPEPGTLVDDPASGLRFTVEEMDERRIVSVTARRIDGVAPTTEP
jgi:CBS domain containing-hemolysin-like protein